MAQRQCVAIVLLILLRTTASAFAEEGDKTPEVTHDGLLLRQRLDEIHGKEKE